MFYVLTLLAIPVLLFAIVVVLFPWLAEESILFTKVREGTVKAIMRGDSFERFVMSFAEHHLNDPEKPWHDAARPDWEVIHHGRDADRYDDRSWILRHLGLYWVGWPWRASVYIYQFEWNETFTERSSGKEKVLPRAEPTDFIYVADFTYAIVTEEAETKDRLPTDELTLATVAVRNPYRALFSGEDWMRRITAAINRHVRDFVGGQTFEELIEAKSSDEFSAPIIELNERLPDDKPGQQPNGLKGRYGVEIRTADLQTIALSGEGKRLSQEATTKKYVATQEAEATLLAGKAKAEVIKQVGTSEAESLEARLKVIKDHGEAGLALAGYDAIQESSKGPGNTIVWANNPLGGLAGLLNPTAKGGNGS